MSRKTTTYKKPMVQALAALVAVLGVGLIGAAPARADHGPDVWLLVLVRPPGPVFPMGRAGVNCFTATRAAAAETHIFEPWVRGLVGRRVEPRTQKPRESRKENKMSAPANEIRCLATAELDEVFGGGVTIQKMDTSVNTGENTLSPTLLTQLVRIVLGRI